MARAKPSSSSSYRPTRTLLETEIFINVYDILPQGRISSILWIVGAPLIHSGVVINGREYAYCGHSLAGVTGVYWTEPKKEPSGTRLRCELRHGATLATLDEIAALIQSASEEFIGTDYNLLTRNCNHFTSALCFQLTGQPGPAWLNRAAGIGVALPCLVPHAWLEPPDFITAEGQLLDDDEQDDTDDELHGGAASNSAAREDSRMMPTSRQA